MSTWAEGTNHALSEAGYRGGGARATVVALLAEQSCCLSAQEIFDELRTRRTPVGIASVYRVLDLLSALRLVQRVDVGDGTARFEPVGPEGEHHHHLVCDDCGRVEAFHDAGLERAIDRVAGTTGYALEGHEIVLRGACALCRAA